jgi:hypothetical protein
MKRRCGPGFEPGPRASKVVTHVTLLPRKKITLKFPGLCIVTSSVRCCQRGNFGLVRQGEAATI